MFTLALPPTHTAYRGGRLFFLISLFAVVAASSASGAQYWLKVVDPGERPLTGVTITWRPGGALDFGTPNVVSGTFQTNQTGGAGGTFFRLMDVSNLDWSSAAASNQINWYVSTSGNTSPYWGTLKIARSGYVPKEIRIEDLAIGYWRRVELRTTPIPSTGGEIDRENDVRSATANVSVRAATGGGISGASVTITMSWGTVYSGTTNSAGDVSISLPDPGGFTLRIQATGYATDTRTGSVRPGDTYSPSVLLVGAPGAPSRLTATVAGSNRIDLSWPDVAGEASYRIERRTGNGSYALVLSPSANSTSQSDTTVAASTTYTYRIRAENSAGNSAFVESSAVTTSAASNPAPNPTPNPTPPSSSSGSSSSSSSKGGGGGSPTGIFAGVVALLLMARRLRLT